MGSKLRSHVVINLTMKRPPHVNWSNLNIPNWYDIPHWSEILSYAQVWWDGGFGPLKGLAWSHLEFLFRISLSMMIFLCVDRSLVTSFGYAWRGCTHNPTPMLTLVSHSKPSLFKQFALSHVSCFCLSTSF